MSDYLYHINGKVYTLSEIEKIAYAVIENEKRESK